jgi:ribonuclease Z
MATIFSAALVNGPFGDPAVFVDFRFEPRALLLDLGDLAALPPRKILRVSDVFVSHTHMDHFCGFDRLLRVCLGRTAGLRLYGPSGFGSRVAHKLAAYTWNLLERYPADFVIEAWDVESDELLRGTRLRAYGRFAAEALEPRTCLGGVILDEPAFRVRAAVLDHGIPCLGYAIEEKNHVNVWKNRLDELGLPTGPWLKALKDAVIQGLPDDTPIRVHWRNRHGEHERMLALGGLRGDVARIIPGEALAYVTDAGYTETNRARIVALARGATRLFIECPFLEQDSDQAAARLHLTARQAGQLARESGAEFVVPFHFSPRYDGREAELRAELAAAHAGAQPAGSSERSVDRRMDRAIDRSRD